MAVGIWLGWLNCVPPFTVSVYVNEPSAILLVTLCEAVLITDTVFSLEFVT